MRERQKLEAIVDGVNPFPEDVQEFVDLLNAVHDKALYRRLLVKAVLVGYQPAIDVLAQGGLFVGPEITLEVEREQRKLEELERRKQMLTEKRRKKEESDRQKNDSAPSNDDGFESFKLPEIQGPKKVVLESKSGEKTAPKNATTGDDLYRTRSQSSGDGNVFNVDLNALPAMPVLPAARTSPSIAIPILRGVSDQRALIVSLLCVVIFLQVILLVMVPCLLHSRGEVAQSSYSESESAKDMVQTSDMGSENVEKSAGKSSQKTSGKSSPQNWVIDKSNMSPETVASDKEDYASYIQSGKKDEQGNIQKVIAGIALDEDSYDEKALYEIAIRVMQKSVSLYLDQPDSARYPQTQKSHNRNNHSMILSGPVDSRNKFGSVGRRNFSVTVQYNSAGMWVTECSVR